MPRHTREHYKTNRRRGPSKAVQFLTRDAILSTPYKTDGTCEQFNLMTFPTEQDARLCVEQRGILNASKFKIRIWPCVFCKGWHETDKPIDYGFDGIPRPFTFDDIYDLYPDVYTRGYQLMSFVKLYTHKKPAKLEEAAATALDLLYRNRIPDEYWSNWWLWAAIRKAYKGTEVTGLYELIPAIREAYDTTPDRDELRDAKKLFHFFKQSKVEYPLTVDSPCYKWIVDGYNLYGKRIITTYHRRAEAKQVAQAIDFDEIQREANREDAAAFIKNGRRKNKPLTAEDLMATK